jgi:hypothetical protein
MESVNMVGKFGEVLLRGVIAILIIPVFFYMISMLVGSAAVLAMLAGQSPLVAFIVTTCIPITYFIIGIIWTIAPLFRKDVQQNQNIYYRG